MGGLRYLTGYADRPPVRMGVSLGDELAGMYAVIGTLAALRARDRDGIGDYVDVALTESAISLLEGTIPEYIHGGVIAERNGNRYLRAAPSNIYPTRDAKWLAIGGNGQGIFRRLVTAMGQPELADAESFATNRARMTNVAELDDLIAAWTAQFDLGELDVLLAKAGVPAGPVMSVADICADPHVRDRRAVTTIPMEGGQLTVAGLVPRMRNHPGRLTHAAGEVGSHHDEVLRELGLAEVTQP